MEYRRLFSEVWGTFLLVLVAAGGGVIGAQPYGGDLTLAMKALAPGMMVMGIIFFMGTISGAHLNPAVTLAFAVRGNFPWRRVPGYIVAEVVGALLAAAFLQLLFGDIIAGATEPGTGVTASRPSSPKRSSRSGWSVSSSARRPVPVMWGSPAPSPSAPTSGWSRSGARRSGSLDESRAIVRSYAVAGDLTNYWIYLVGPLVGAMIAVVFERILRGKATKAGAEAAQGVLDEDVAGL